MYNQPNFLGRLGQGEWNGLKHVGRMRVRNEFTVLVGIREGKNCLWVLKGGRTWGICLIIRGILKAVGCDVVDWLYLAQDTIKCQGFVNMLMY